MFASGSRKLNISELDPPAPDKLFWTFWEDSQNWTSNICQRHTIHSDPWSWVANSWWFIRFCNFSWETFIPVTRDFHNLQLTEVWYIIRLSLLLLYYILHKYTVQHSLIFTTSLAAGQNDEKAFWSTPIRVTARCCFRSCATSPMACKPAGCCCGRHL